MLPDFFNLYARTETGQKFLSGKASRTADGKFNINTGTIKSVLVPLPEISEQKEIVFSIEPLLKKIKHHQTKKQTLAELFKTMLHQLMTGTTRVNNLQLRKAYKNRRFTVEHSG